MTYNNQFTWRYIKLQGVRQFLPSKNVNIFIDLIEYTIKSIK